jgi:3'-5' exoribonuclease
MNNLRKEKKQFISDLKVGSIADTIFVVSKKQVRKKKNNEDYCIVTLQDKEGSIEGVIWTEVFKNSDDFSEGDFVLVKGDVKQYRNSMQLVINSISKIENKEDIEYSDFIRATKKNIDVMFSEIKSYIDSIKNSYLKELLDLYFKDKKFIEDFKNSTAAVRYHHAYRGGLLEHTLAVTKICDMLTGIYDNLNRDLLISGAILHDIGKIREYETGVTIKVSDEGKLLGHITIGYGWILEKIKKIKGFPRDLSERLLHIILSHHGQKEFGSPRRPKILEAFVVYHVDHMDADIGGYNIILEESRDGEDWSGFAKNFERSIYLKKLKLINENEENTDNEINKTDENNLNQNKKIPRQPDNQDELF